MKFYVMRVLGTMGGAELASVSDPFDTIKDAKEYMQAMEQSVCDFLAILTVEGSQLTVTPDYDL